jgi:predicted enzyme related to lactoylglutathione lyase
MMQPSLAKNDSFSLRAAALMWAAVVLLAVVGLSDMADASVQQSAAFVSSGSATTLPIKSVPTTPSQGTSGPAAPGGTILMIKLSVGDVSAAEKFYGAVFGAKLALKVGSVPILTFPKGGPGLVLLKRGPHDKNKVGGFIIQVPSLSQAKALALTHGAKFQGKFSGTPSSQAAQSIDLLDPWGNNVEILQLG